MEKTCPCGETMRIQLRTIVYQDQVELEDVPVYTCGSCGRNELYSEVKTSLTGLLEKLEMDNKQKQPKVKISFSEHNELALLISKASDPEHWNEPVQALLENRINELLDLLLVAQSLNDDAWSAELRDKLSQIADYSRSALT
ncbi:hypothetical protein [Paenibacillus senegalensis]|uniref:hypothetical protein n=1 Tax=Paenibacillus senegalensis TaxID=1465766 RepID=UPI0002882631|nr:hypothetical protein [Paenibacillus senegalensis]